MTETENLILTGCKQKVRSAQQALYVNYKNVLRTICCRYLQNSAEAEDALHDVFMHVFRKINQFKGEGSLEGWLKRVAVNHCLGILRKKKYFEVQPLEIADGELVIDDEQTPLYSKRELEHALKKIPIHFTVVFSLFYIEEYSHKEISKLLGIDEKTSRSRLHRAKKLLKKELQKLSI